jgi:hypothetical protein
MGKWTPDAVSTTMRATDVPGIMCAGISGKGLIATSLALRTSKQSRPRNTRPSAARRSVSKMPGDATSCSVTSAMGASSRMSSHPALTRSRVCAQFCRFRSAETTRVPALVAVVTSEHDCSCLEYLDTSANVHINRSSETCNLHTWHGAAEAEGQVHAFDIGDRLWLGARQLGRLIAVQHGMDGVSFAASVCTAVGPQDVVRHCESLCEGQQR